MATVVPRNETYRLLEDARDQLNAAIVGLTPDELVVSVDGGWSVKDMVTHLTSWEELILIDLRRLKLRRVSANYCRGTDEWNPILMTGRDSFPLEQVLDELTESREAIKRALEEISDDQFTSGGVPGACQVLAMHDWQHATDINNWRMAKGEVI